MRSRATGPGAGAAASAFVAASALDGAGASATGPGVSEAVAAGGSGARGGSLDEPQPRASQTDTRQEVEDTLNFMGARHNVTAGVWEPTSVPERGPSTVGEERR